MKQRIIMILLFILCIHFSLAAVLDANGNVDWSKYGAQAQASNAVQPSGTIDKDILTIYNCYNLTVSYQRTSGNVTPVYFKNCNNLGDNTWNCNCRDTVGDYHLIMQNSGVDLVKERDYKIIVNYSYYDISNANTKFIVRDWGDSFDIRGNDLEDLGKAYIIVDKIIYVNQTVFVDKIVEKEVPVNVPVDKIVYVDNYIENTTITDACNAQVDRDKTMFAIGGVAIILLLIFCGYMFMRLRQ